MFYIQVSCVGSIIFFFFLRPVVNVLSLRVPSFTYITLCLIVHSPPRLKADLKMPVMYIRGGGGQWGWLSVPGYGDKAVDKSRRGALHVYWGSCFLIFFFSIICI